MFQKSTSKESAFNEAKRLNRWLWVLGKSTHFSKHKSKCDSSVWFREAFKLIPHLDILLTPFFHVCYACFFLHDQRNTYGKIVVLGCWCRGSRLIIYEAFKSMCPPQSISTFGHPFNELRANITGIQKSFKMSKWAFIVHGLNPGHHFVCFGNKNRISC